MKPLVRWTIGNTTKNGFECLRKSIESFMALYEADVIICHNGSTENLPNYKLYDQRKEYLVKPRGVAWKLYPPRLDIERHEIIIDNDIVFENNITQIDEFLNSDCTLLLEGDGRIYGKFSKHVPANFEINSGIYGMPPGFDFDRYVKFYSGNEWEMNAFGRNLESATFDEQGLVALALLDYKKHLIIPKTSITNCEHEFVPSHGMHFIGLNRSKFHRPYQLYLNYRRKMFI